MLPPDAPPAPMRLPPGIPIDPSLLEPYIESLIRPSTSDSEAAEDSSSGDIHIPNQDQSQGQDDTESQESYKTHDPPSARPHVPRPLPPSPRLSIRRKPLPPSASTAAIYTPLPPRPQPPPSEYAPTHTSHLYKNYLHKLPHTRFTEHDQPGTCLACDAKTATVHYTCDLCGLALCGVCHYLITEEPIRGSLRLLISHVARWKVGYSKAFLEREDEEVDRERERVEERRVRREREWREGRGKWRETIVEEEDEGMEVEVEEGVREVGEEESDEGGVPIDVMDGIQEMIRSMERERFPDRERDNGELENGGVENGEVENGNTEPEEGDITKIKN